MKKTYFQISAGYQDLCIVDSGEKVEAILSALMQNSLMVFGEVKATAVDDVFVSWHTSPETQKRYESLADFRAQKPKSPAKYLWDTDISYSVKSRFGSKMEDWRR